MDAPKALSNQCQPYLRLKSGSGSEEVVYYSVLYQGLPDQFQIMAEMELNETDEKRKIGMQRLRNFIKKENLGSVCDIYLLSVIRTCKYDLKKSEAKLKNFVVKRRLMVDQIAKLDMDKLKRIIDDLPVGILPYRDQHGRAVIYSRPYGVNLEMYDMKDIFLVGLSLMLFVMSFPITTVSGVVYFAECDSPSLHIFYSIFKSFRQHIYNLLAIPFRVARIDALNEMSLVRFLMNIVTPVVPEKIRKRLFWHGAGYDNLHKYYDPNILPDAFGGNLGPLSSEFYKEKFLDFIRQLKEETLQNAPANL